LATGLTDITDLGFHVRWQRCRCIYDDDDDVQRFNVHLKADEKPA